MYSEFTVTFIYYTVAANVECKSWGQIHEKYQVSVIRVLEGLDYDPCLGCDCGNFGQDTVQLSVIIHICRNTNGYRH